MNCQDKRTFTKLELVKSGIERRYFCIMSISRGLANTSCIYIEYNYQKPGNPNYCNLSSKSESEDKEPLAPTPRQRPPAMSRTIL